MLLDWFMQWDKELLIALNGIHASWLDPVMLLVTHTLFWSPLYLFLIVLLFRNFKSQAWFLVIGVALALLLSDQLTSELIKPYFERLRPTHDPSMEGVVHLVQGYRADRYGFSSGHAANTFAVALFAWFTLRSRYKWMSMIFVWAGVMTYTRIYLGVHFPGDILAGVLLGLICGVIGLATSHYLRRWLGVAKGAVSTC
jgi:undecaprenyl-diphosphatase